MCVCVCTRAYVCVCVCVCVCVDVVGEDSQKKNESQYRGEEKKETGGAPLVLTYADVC
jgi:hypothetical protein